MPEPGRPRAAVVGVAGERLSEAERGLFVAAPPLGVILFGRNVADPGQLAALVSELREVAPLLMVDQEGGRVARLRPPHWDAHPPAGVVGRAGVRAAWLQGALVGAQCWAAGFGMVAAPVLDLRVAGADAVIGDRAFSDDPAVVAACGAAMAAGLMATGVLAVVKHMPGHGRAGVDSHYGLPVVDGLGRDAEPFARLADAPWGMTAHVVYRGIDDRPGTLSPVVIGRVIRGMIGFGGILMTDDLAMGALKGTAGERAEAAFAAGCDVALHCSGVLAETAAVLAAAPCATDRIMAACVAPAAGALDVAAWAAERAGLVA